MKKTITILATLFVIGIFSGNAQTEKKQPPPPPPPRKVDVIVKAPPPTITIKDKQADEFYKRNPSIMDISRQDNLITLKMKDGTTEKYNMSKKEEKKNFTDKYGKAPIPDPPPPSLPPKKLS